MSQARWIHSVYHHHHLSLSISAALLRWRTALFQLASCPGGGVPNGFASTSGSGSSVLSLGQHEAQELSVF